MGHRGASGHRADWALWQRRLRSARTPILLHTVGTLHCALKLSALTTWMRRPARLSFPSGSIAFVNKHLRSTVQSSFDLTIIYLTTDFCKAVQYGGNGNLRCVIVSRAIHCAMQTWPEEHCKQTSWQTSQGASAVTAATWLHIQC